MWHSLRPRNDFTSMSRVNWVTIWLENVRRIKFNSGNHGLQKICNVSFSRDNSTLLLSKWYLTGDRMKASFSIILYETLKCQHLPYLFVSFLIKYTFSSISAEKSDSKWFAWKINGSEFAVVKVKTQALWKADNRSQLNWVRQMFLFYVLLQAFVALLSCFPYRRKNKHVFLFAYLII